MFDVHEKNDSVDLPVIIEDYVWIRANVIILKGITIAKGTNIGAGSLVTKSAGPYAINLGMPAKLYKYRWIKEEIKRHEQMIKKF